jgi:hypothetical protein
MDAAFLYVETQETPMHAVALQYFELPEGYRGSFFEDFKKHLLERMHLIPFFHEHLHTTPLGLDHLPFFHEHLHTTPLGLDHPVWVEDEAFDIDYHLRHLALPAPGGTDELTRLAETLYPPLLDRSRPLWEYTIIEGLESGHVVLYTKGHHACLDGVPSPDRFPRGRCGRSRSPDRFACFAARTPTCWASLGGRCERCRTRRRLRSSWAGARSISACRVPRLGPASTCRSPIDDASRSRRSR